MYYTLPIIEIDDNISQDLQQNVSDMVYAVFYSSGSSFKAAFNEGYNKEALQNFLFKSIEGYIQDMESNLGSKYVIDEINVDRFEQEGEKVSIIIRVRSKSLSLPVGVELVKGLI